MPCRCDLGAERMMLVLSRKVNEAIVINEDIVITVLEIREDRIRLGIEAPPQVAVHRREVFDSIHREEHGQAEPEGEVSESDDQASDEESFFA